MKWVAEWAPPTINALNGQPEVPVSEEVPVNEEGSPGR